MGGGGQVDCTEIFYVSVVNYSVSLWVIKFQSCWSSCLCSQFSSFFQCLDTTLQNISNFSTLLLIWPHWELNLPLSWSPRSWSWWPQIMYVVQLSCLLLWGPFRKSAETPDAITKDIQTAKDNSSPSSGYLLNAFPLGSETSFIVCANQ